MPRTAAVKNEITFLGTGGARIVVARQIRATGGLFLRLQGVNILVDPGPGALVRFLSYLPKFSPLKIDYLVLSHKHIDHSASINVMIEAMTDGGVKRRGVLIAPYDALEDDPVVLRYLRKYLTEIDVLRAGATYRLKDIKMEAPVKHIHGVETYGLIFRTKKYSISYITDSKYFPALAKKYPADIAIISLLRDEPSPYEHLSIPDVEKIIKGNSPKVVFITHFGMKIIRLGPKKVAKDLSARTGVRVIAAEDGKTINVEKVLYG